MPKPKVDQFVDENEIKSFVCPRCGNRSGLDIVGGYYEKGSNTFLYRCHGYYRHDECNYTVGVKNPDSDVVWASPNGDWGIILTEPRVYEAGVMMTDGWNSWCAEIDGRRDIVWDEMTEYRVPKTVRDQAKKILYREYDNRSKAIGRRKPIRYVVIARDGVPAHEDHPKFFDDYDKADKYAASLYDAIEQPYAPDGYRRLTQVGRLGDVYYDESEIPMNFGYSIMRQYDDSRPPKKKSRRGLLR